MYILIPIIHIETTDNAVTHLLYVKYLITSLIIS